MSVKDFTDNKIEIPPELFNKIKGKTIVKWKITKENIVELEFGELSEKCKELEEELNEIEAEMDDGEYFKGDVDALAGKIGL